MAGKAQRVTIGFAGGQVLGVRAGADDVEALRAALERGGWHDLPAEDGPVLLYLPQVVYVRTDADEPQVGFGA